MGASPSHTTDYTLSIDYYMGASPSHTTDYTLSIDYYMGASPSHTTDYTLSIVFVVTTDYLYNTCSAKLTTHYLQ